MTTSLQHETAGDARTAPARFLVAVDGSTAAGRATSAVSRLAAPGAEVRLIVVLTYGDYPYSLAGGHLSDEGEREAKVAGVVAESTAQAMATIGAAGHAVSVVHRFGLPAEEILAEAEAWQPDVIVLGHRGVRAPAKWVLGVSEKVLHHTSVPVLLVP